MVESGIEQEFEAEVDLVKSIYTRLREWRRCMAAALGLPPYIIMSNAHLAGVALAAPATAQELSCCPGIGEKKLVEKVLAGWNPAPQQEATPF